MEQHSTTLVEVGRLVDPAMLVEAEAVVGADGSGVIRCERRPGRAT